MLHFIFTSNNMTLCIFRIALDWYAGYEAIDPI